MKHSSLISMLICLIAAVFVSPAMAQLTDAGSLAGTQWQLVSYGAPDSLTPVAEGTSITLDFPANNQVAGSGGCNGYSGTYGVAQANIEFRDIVSTLLACANDIIAQQEQTYFNALGSASGYAQTETTLTLWYDNGQQQLNFVRIRATQNLLANTSWQLASYGTPDSLTSVIGANPLTLEFLANNQVAGSGGCNSYSGAYSLQEDTLAFSDIISTLVACTDAAVGAQEQTYFDALALVGTYAFTNAGLTLWYNNGQQQLNFVPLTMENIALENTEWQLESYGTADALIPVVAGSNVTIHFMADNRVDGSGGCNNYSANYAVENDSLTFSEVVSTLMACADAAVTQQEQTFLTALRSASRFESTGSQLTIWFDNAQQQLNFRFVSHQAAILEGSSWQLASFGDSNASSSVISGSIVSLNFVSATEIEGSGGCNSYSGTYQTAGTAITFSEITHTEVACADQTITNQEQIYFDALQAATQYEGFFDRLVISHPTGRLTFIIVPNQSSPKVCTNPWIVEAGDSLSSIAEACNTTLEALLAANPTIQDPSLLFVGQEITIPSGNVPIPTQAPVAPTQAPNQQAIVFPEPSGEYAVGRASYFLVDTGREEIFTEAEGDARELVLRVYYPAELPANAQLAPYAEGVLRDSLLIAPEQADLIQTRVYENVPFAAGTFPVLIFSPGMGALPLNYTSLLTDVASHGYIVAAISHPYSTAVTVFPDGRAIYASAEGSVDAFADPASSQEASERIGAVWVNDVLLTVDQLGEFNISDGLLAGHLNMEQIGIFGHSFGGGTAIEASYLDNRFKAAINMDGPLFGGVVGQALLQPFMAMFSTEWTITDEAVAQAGISRADYEARIASYLSDYTEDLHNLLNNSTLGYSLRLSGIAHFSFATDLTLFAPQVPDILPQTTVGTMPAERAIELISAYIVGFFDQNLKGENSPLLSGESAPHPEATVEMFPAT